MSVKGLFHIGVYTADIEESIDFYTHILGFEKQWEGIVDHPTGKIHAAVLKAGDCTIELVRPVDINRVSNTPGPVQHIALRVDDVGKWLKKLKEMDANLEFEEVETLHTFMKGIRHIFLYGPSNERIELVEELKL